MQNRYALPQIGLPVHSQHLFFQFSFLFDISLWTFLFVFCSPIEGDFFLCISSHCLLLQHIEDSERETTGVSEGDMVTLDELKNRMAEFAKERDWDQFHSPRNLLLALVGEVGELSEIFQWKGEVPKGLPGWKDEEKQHLGEELSDVLLYLVRLSDICGVDLGKAALRKLELNAIKYPVSLCKGSSNKYTNINNNGNNMSANDGYDAKTDGGTAGKEDELGSI